jgi:sugar lactone lactonase YvrE
VDGTTNDLYIADSGNHEIRKVDFASGTISTIAGTGTPGYNGDAIAATSAQLNQPNGVALDSNGNVYIAETGGNRIRMVSASTGKISTIAGNGTGGFSGDGGPATSAEIGPYSVAVDSLFNVFLTDGNYRIREVSASTGDINTVAGNGGYGGDGGPATLATLNNPYGLAFDSSGNLYVADLANCVIREVEFSTGKMQSFAGNGTCGDTGDGGAATSAELEVLYLAVDSNNNIYISDPSNCVVRQVNSTTGVIRLVAGNGTCGAYAGDGGPATSAELNQPGALAMDPSDALYILDSALIRRVDPGSGIITTYAGNGALGYAGDGGVATNAAFQAVGIAFDAEGNLYIADRGNNRIREVAAGSLIVSTLAGDGTAASTGDGGPATAAQVNDPQSIVTDTKGNLFFSDNQNRIRKITAATGLISTAAGNGVNFFFTPASGVATSVPIQLQSLAFDPSGNLYFSSPSSNVIQKLTPTP